jgi:glycosyltransferase involved in cell wall biosynthesis
MHLLYLHQYFCPPGGSGNDRSLQFAQYFAQAGHKVTVVTSDAYFPPSQKLNQEPYRLLALGENLQVHVLPVAYSHQMRFRRRIASWLQFYRAALRLAKQLPAPDLIYASSTPLTVGELGRKLHHHWGIPFVFETVDVWPDVPEGMGLLTNPVVLRTVHRRTERIYEEASRIVALSEGMRDQILAHQVPTEKVVVIHNGTDPLAFACSPRPPRSPAVALYAGTVGIANDLTLLLDAMAKVELVHPNAMLLRIVGDGNDLARVKAHKERLGLKGVEFLPSVPKAEVRDLLQAADIGVVCFGAWKVLEANSANKFYDYLAAGLPVVTNYEGWQATYLRQHDCGLSVPQGDAEALAQALLRLAGNAQMRREMGERGRALAAAQFDRKDLAHRLMGIFEEVLQTAEKEKGGKL